MVGEMVKNLLSINYVMGGKVSKSFFHSSHHLNTLQQANNDALQMAFSALSFIKNAWSYP